MSQEYANGISFKVFKRIICQLNNFRAATNKKMKETVAIELSYLNSNLQLLKEQLADLNSSMELYQMEGASKVGLLMPMIPLGLKETKEIDMKVIITTDKLFPVQKVIPQVKVDLALELIIEYDGWIPEISISDETFSKDLMVVYLSSTFLKICLFYTSTASNSFKGLSADPDTPFNP